VDLLPTVGFAGGGGSSAWRQAGAGVRPDLAMNHWLTAVLAHQRHFPETEHHCADIFDVDPRAWRPGERIAFGWFSPDCTDFSKAKGKAPRSERIRGLAWSVIPWALTRRIDVIMLENVEEFAQWGPVYRAGARKRGRADPGAPRRDLPALEAPAGEAGLRRRVAGAERRRLRRAHHPQAALPGRPLRRPKPIVWPERTHAPRKDAGRLGLKPWRGACEIIDWSQDCPSIFLTPAEVEDLRKRTGKRVQRPLVAATQKRIARGMERYVIGAAEPFIVPITQRGWDATARTACAIRCGR
jgi:DNA (cytosine-5)-methyltransferase 1